MTLSKKAQKILAEKSTEFPGWHNTFDNFLRIYLHGLQHHLEDTESVWRNTAEMYHKIMETMIAMSGIRDNWDQILTMPLAVPAGLAVLHRADRITCPFQFGTDELGFFLSADLIYSEHIRKMDDNFWFRLAELSQIGQLDSWESQAWPDGQARREPWYHKKTKSKIFQIIRSSVALEEHYGDSQDLGAVIVRWDYQTPWSELLEKATHAFINLYRINEALWKKDK